MSLRHNVDLPFRPPASGFVMGRGANAVELRRKTQSSFSTGFLAFWLAGWTTTSALLIALVWRDPHPVHLLFALPFWGFWAYVLFLVLDHAFGRELLRVNALGLDYCRSILIPIQRRRIPVWEVGTVGEYARVVDRQSGRQEWGICVETPQRPLIFALGASPEERKWLMHSIRGHFGVLEADDLTEPPDRAVLTEQTGAADCRAVPEEEELIHIPSRQPPRPAGSPWTSRRVRNGLRLEWKGRWRWKAILLLTLLNLGCFGLLGLIRMNNAADTNILRSVLAACASIAMAILLTAWIASISLRFVRRQWTLGHEEIISRFTVFGICHTTWYPIAPIASVRVQREGGYGFGGRPDLCSLLLGLLLGRDRSLVLVDEQQSVIAKLRALNHAEARWIGQLLLRTYAGKLDAANR